LPTGCSAIYPGAAASIPGGRDARFVMKHPLPGRLFRRTGRRACPAGGGCSPRGARRRNSPPFAPLLEAARLLARAIRISSSRPSAVDAAPTRSGAPANRCRGDRSGRCAGGIGLDGDPGGPPPRAALYQEDGPPPPSRAAWPGARGFAVQNLPDFVFSFFLPSHGVGARLS
jgi:hypothetical protein